MPPRSPMWKRAIETRNLEAIETVYQLAKWPDGTAPLSYGPLASARLVGCVTRGWAEKTGKSDAEGRAIYRVTELGFAQLFAKGIAAPEVGEVA